MKQFLYALCIASLVSGGFGRNACGQAMLRDWYGGTGWLSKSDFFGRSVAGIGDVDGDGVPDAIIGAQRAHDGSGVEYGKAYVKSGASGTLLHEYTGPDKGSIFGICVAGGGDFDGDKTPDYLVGAPWAGGVYDEGMVVVYSGATGWFRWLLTGAHHYDELGWSVVMLGDVDHDRCADFATGAFGFPGTSARGRAYVYSGRTGVLIWSVIGANAGEALGYYLCCIDDLDGDRVAELGVGAPGSNAGSSGQGTFTVYSGATGTLIHYLEGELHSDHFGDYSAGLGDLDGDGVVDFAVAASGKTVNVNSEGRVYVYSGATAGLMYQFDGQQAFEHLGASLPVHGNVDFNDDGYADLLMGSPANVTGGACGIQFVYSGRTGKLLYAIRGRMDNGLGEGMGSSVDRFGDLNGDGIDDIIVGADFCSRDQPAAGRAYVFAGNDLFLQANATTFNSGDAIDLDVRGGFPGSIAMIVLTDVSGASMFVPMAIAPLDADGNLQLAATVPTGLSGLTATFMGYAQKASGRGLADSIPETIAFN